MKAISDRLEAGVKEVFSSEKYRDYLTAMSKFYHYSSRNTLLIYMQNPNASHVASFSAWKTMGRSVN
ncbi:MAG: ArdC-like ssDNA-binding domain-containing protein, partial [Angelakisella sp.]